MTSTRSRRWPTPTSNKDGTIADDAPRKTFRQAATQIVIADVSMSLDNVLAVAGAAQGSPDGADHRPCPVDRADGLRGQLHREPSEQAPLDRLSSALLIILYVALNMIWDGWHEVLGLMS